ncbi:acyl-CoA dehydrogenase family protein [Sphingomonas profundi]|uniref:acyl-CoA dehydrogenase family protein n=1 Tax=Alterirhizorhabdus profundi TaxID=2681549 RepID=UPI0012E7EED9|nr:acyl-CoA dehydrogenase family protein [Sphingomonas profundi]
MTSAAPIAPSSTSTALAERVASFVRSEIAPLEQDPRCGPHGPNNALIVEIRGKARVLGLLVPHLGPEWGGTGLAISDMVPVFKAAGFSPLGPIALNIQAPDEGNMHLLDVVASDSQKARYLKPLAAGLTRSAFLMTEPDGGAGSDPSMLATYAERTSNRTWRIRGRKTFATGFDGSAFTIVMARTGGGATMFLVPTDAAGMRTERVLATLDSSMPGGHAVVTLDDVEVDDDAVLGAVDKGFQYAQVRLAPARLTHCMRWWGLARRVQDIAIDYACRCHAFGRPIIDHEGVGNMLADNEMDLTESELIIDWCAAALEREGTGTYESSVAKVRVSEALFRIADRAMQVLGGTGITGDTIVEQAFREFRAFRIYDGPSEVHRWSIAKRLKRQHGQPASV